MTGPTTVPWPEDVAASYVARGYWRRQPFGSLMWELADRWGERTALVDQDRRISYRGLAAGADALGERLAATGLQAGDTVLVQLPNCWEYFALLLACARIGVIPVLALPPHREHELDHLARHAGVRAIAVPDSFRGFDHQTLAEQVAARTAPPGTAPVPVLVVGEKVRGENLDVRRALAVEGDPPERRRRLDAIAPDPDSPLLFLLSGGTTGMPKIVGRTHNDYEYSLRRSAEICRFGKSTVYLAVLPVAHNFALGSPGVLGALLSGGRAVLQPTPEPAVAFGTMRQEGVTDTSVVPAVARRWLDNLPQDAPCSTGLRVLQVGGAALFAPLAHQLTDAFGCTVQQVYGMAEGMLNYTRLDDPPEVAAETQGRPMSPADEVLIVGDDGLPVPPGEPGELLTRGPCTPRGYFASPDHNARAYTPDGWYRTGDIVRLHPSGNFSVVGRSKDVVNRGGEKISATEVENLVLTMPQVHDVAVVPAPHGELGECVCACVVPGAGAEVSLARIREHFHSLGVAHYKVPEQLLLLETLPRTPVGKIDKKALRSAVGTPRS